MRIELCNLNSFFSSEVNVVIIIKQWFPLGSFPHYLIMPMLHQSQLFIRTCLILFKEKKVNSEIRVELQQGTNHWEYGFKTFLTERMKKWCWFWWISICSTVCLPGTAQRFYVKILKFCLFSSCMSLHCYLKLSLWKNLLNDRCATHFGPLHVYLQLHINKWICALLCTSPHHKHVKHWLTDWQFNSTLFI